MTVDEILYKFRIQSCQNAAISVAEYISESSSLLVGATHGSLLQNLPYVACKLQRCYFKDIGNALELEQHLTNE